MNEYIAKAIPQGSSLYYSLRFIAPKQREAISYLYAFSYEIEMMVSEVKELEIAERKLNWWRQELQNLRDGKPQHPLAQALLPFLQEYNIAATILSEILEGIARRLTNPNYPDFKTFSEQHYRAISSFPLLVNLVCVANERPLGFIHDLGIMLQTIEVIMELRNDLRHGYLYLPEQDLKAFNISEQDLFNLNMSDNLVLLLKQLAEQARNYYNQALTKLETNQHHSQLANLIMAKLYYQLLAELEHDNFQVFSHKITLSPIRKLWLAYKSYWQTGRVQNLC
ncbi:MAG: squalene synthase HpnD [Gammaproteobacteria bacterium]|jgi:phytoene synthase|nr:squalene synthase HpnD [Gammaproteobacteria bacterium]